MMKTFAAAVALAEPQIASHPAAADAATRACLCRYWSIADRSSVTTASDRNSSNCPADASRWWCRCCWTWWQQHPLVGPVCRVRGQQTEERCRFVAVFVVVAALLEEAVDLSSIFGSLCRRIRNCTPHQTVQSPPLRSVLRRRLHRSPSCCRPNADGEGGDVRRLRSEPPPELLLVHFDMMAHGTELARFDGTFLWNSGGGGSIIT